MLNNFSRDRVFMVFGSLCNAYSRTMKPKDFEEFKEHLKTLFLLAKKMVDELYKNASGFDGVNKRDGSSFEGMSRGRVYPDF